MSAAAAAVSAAATTVFASFEEFHKEIFDSLAADVAAFVADAAFDEPDATAAYVVAAALEAAVGVPAEYAVEPQPGWAFRLAELYLRLAVDPPNHPVGKKHSDQRPTSCSPTAGTSDFHEQGNALMPPL